MRTLEEIAADAAVRATNEGASPILEIHAALREAVAQERAALREWAEGPYGAHREYINACEDLLDWLDDREKSE